MTLSTRIRWGTKTSEEVAHDLIGGVGTRWEHTLGVVRRAKALTAAVPGADKSVLISAAWLHDIGYSPSVFSTGFHPLDGAAFLRSAGCPKRLCGLVAHHSGARYSAAVLGLAGALAVYGDERSPVSDALCYADQTTGPCGEYLPMDRRAEETLRRHGPDSVQAMIQVERGPALLGAASRVTQRLFADQRLVEHVSEKSMSWRTQPC